MQTTYQYFLFFFFLSFFTAFAQKEANIWYFGTNAGLDFNSGTPEVLLDGVLDTFEGCATISDTNGNLLFYTDGITVYNRNHTIMLNGTGLNGDPSSTHSALIVPKPNDANTYYIFTVDEQAGPNGLQYSEVDLQLDGGLGGVTTNKNILLYTPTTEKITAIKSSTENAFWVVSHKWNSNEFIAYKITETGIDITPVVSAVGSTIEGTPTDKAIGQIKISPNGTKLAVARNEGLSEVQLFDFDASTGVVFNPITLLDFPDGDEEAVYGLEFSPNSKIVYVSVLGNGVFQYNLEAGSSDDIIASQLELTTLPRPYGGMQLATDGKIYIAKSGQKYIDFIDQPNVVGLGCGYQYEALYIGDGDRFSRLGLPPFIQSFLFIENILFEKICFGDATEFSLTDTVDTASWNFGDPASGGNNISTSLTPTHVFSAPGTYEVSVTVTVGAESTTATASVTIYEQATATQPTDINICDTNNDGFYAFDLTSQNTAILNGQAATTFEVDYFASMTDYTNDNPIGNPNNYTNATAYTSQTMIARVRNKNQPACEATTSFEIHVFESPTPAINIDRLAICDDTSVGTDSDGQVVFDLTQKAADIFNGQSESTFELSYFTDAALTTAIANPTSFTNTSNPQTIYVQMSHRNNTSCVAQTSFEVAVLELPTVNAVVSLKQCDTDNDGFSAFNLEEANVKISNNHINETFTFYETQIAAENDTATIPNPTAYTNEAVSTDTVWVRIENNDGCYRTAQVNLVVSTTQVAIATPNTFYQCDDGLDTTDGVATFDFSPVQPQIEALFPVGQQLTISYYRNEADALSESNAIVDIGNYQNIGYPNTQSIYVRVDSNVDNDCLGLGSPITLVVEQQPIANSVTINPECDNDRDGLFAFDTSNIENTLIGSQTGVTVSYTDQSGTALSSPLPNPFMTATQTITVRITNTTSQDLDGACFDETTIDFVVNAVPVANPVPTQEQCDEDTDGISNFDTSNIESTLLGSQTGLVVRYFDASGTELASPLPNPFTTSSQTLTVRLENPAYAICYEETTIDFVVREKPTFELIETATICMTDNPQLEVSIENPNGSYSYTWTDENNNTVGNGATINFVQGGTYNVIATSIFGCESETKQIVITESAKAVLTSEAITVTDDSQNNSIVIDTNILGIGDYEFQLSNLQGTIIRSYQESPLFENLQGGVYTLEVRDKNGCGITVFDISVLSFPRFFTPNEDGINDVWQVKGVHPNFYQSGSITIFDRFGKSLAKFSTQDRGWEGTYGGKKLPSNDYWFFIELIDINGVPRIRRGHFSLLRR